MSRLNENIRYALQEEAAIEDFDDGSLVFLCQKRHLIQINETAGHIIKLIDGERTLKEIIELISGKFSIAEDTARKDLMELVDELGSAGALRPIVNLGYGKGRTMKETSHYLANPSISLREEDGEGAILFDAKSDALLIINPVGLIIWKYLQPHPRTKADIVAHLKEMCDDVPDKQVETDVDEFLKDLLGKRFVGEVLDD